MPADSPPTLRDPNAPKAKIATAVGLVFCVGLFAAILVSSGNPGNMGICGACFLRDLAGALGMTTAAKAPAVFRPELAGIVLGATALALIRRRFVARSGSYAAARFGFGVVMAIAALVFLGCPFRLLQRLGGGDLHAWVALPGFVAGVLCATFFERRSYRIGATRPAPTPVGLVGPLVFAGLLTAYLFGALKGAGPDGIGPPPRADWRMSIVFSLSAGIVLSGGGFCAIASVRSAFGPSRVHLYAALALIAGYALPSAFIGKTATWSFDGAPVAHGDALWNLVAAFTLGAVGAFAGGCPVRQLVMTGEGNGDAFATVAGIVVGGGAAHTFGFVSAAATAEHPGGATPAGKIALLAGLAASFLFAATTAASHRATDPKP
jgi:uncharacterized protein